MNLIKNKVSSLIPSIGRVMEKGAVVTFQLETHSQKPPDAIMVGKRTLRILFFVTRLCEVLGCPWSLDLGTKTLVIPSNGRRVLGYWVPWKELKFQFASFVIFSYSFFSLIRLVEAIWRNGDSYQGLMIQAVLLACSGLRSAVILNTWNDPRGVVAYFNRFLAYDRKMSSRSLILLKNRQSFVEVCQLFVGLYGRKEVKDEALPFVLFFSILAAGQFPSLTLFYLINQSKSIYLGSVFFLIPAEYLLLRILAYVGFLLFEMYMIGMLVAICLLYGFYFIVIYQSYIFWIQEST